MVWTFCRPQITCSKVPEVLYSFNLVCLFQQVWVHFQMYPNFVFVTPWFHFATFPLSTHSNPPSNNIFFDPHFHIFNNLQRTRGNSVKIKRKFGSAKPFIVAREVPKNNQPSCSATQAEFTFVLDLSQKVFLSFPKKLLRRWVADVVIPSRSHLWSSEAAQNSLHKMLPDHDFATFEGTFSTNYIQSFQNGGKTNLSRVQIILGWK